LDEGELYICNSQKIGTIFIFSTDIFLCTNKYFYVRKYKWCWMKNVHKYKTNNYLLERVEISDVHLCAYVILLSIYFYVYEGLNLTTIQNQQQECREKKFNNNKRQSSTEGTCGDLLLTMRYDANMTSLKRIFDLLTWWRKKNFFTVHLVSGRWMEMKMEIFFLQTFFYYFQNNATVTDGM